MVSWFTPIRTATRSCNQIMDYFGFDINRNHDDNIVEDLSMCTFIMNVHNPYKRLFSIYNLHKYHNPDSEFEFQDWVSMTLEELNEKNNPQQISLFYYYKLFSKKPDYIVKVENLFYDLMKIQFINQNYSDKLKNIFDNYVLKNEFEEGRDWKSKYNENFSNLIYHKLRDDFEIFGYDKDSWMS